MRTKSALLMAAMAVATFGSRQTWAVDWTITSGGTYQVTVGGAGLGAGDGIIVDGSVNTTAVIIRVDGNTPALGTNAKAALNISAAVAVTIQFEGTNNFVLGNADNTSILINAGGGSLAVTNGGGASGSFVFSANTNKILTIDGPVTGTDAVNTFTMGNNTLRATTTNPVTLNAVSLGGANATLNNTTATTVTTLTMTGALNITPADTMVLTLTNAVAVGANTLTVTGSGGAGAEAVNGTLTLNNAGSIVTTAGADVDDVLGDVTVTVSADGATLDVNFNTSPVAVNMTAGAGNLTLQVATGKTLTTVIDVNDNTLTVSEAGTVSTVTMDTAAGILDVNETMTVTTLAPSASMTADVAASKTLTVTNGLSFGTNTLTLTGTGTISRADATTGTITDNGGTTITDLRITPGAGTFTWNGTGSGTVTDFLTNSTFATGNIISKAGTGSLVITNGVAGYFSTAATQTINVTAGTLTCGAAGANNAITFSQDEDEIVVSSGATLTTFGNLAVGTAGTNVNLDAATGSTVNLSGTSARTLTGLADDDFNLLGTVNINGSSSYTISDAFNYKFGSVTIGAGSSLINNQPSGEMKFVSGSLVDINDSAALTINGQATDTPITIDTTSGSGSFTIDRNSGTLTIQNASLSRVAYTSDSCGGADCHISFIGVTILDATSGWLGGCCDGGSTTTPDLTETDSTTTQDTIGTDGNVIVLAETASGTTAEVMIDGGTEGDTITLVLEDSNSQNTFSGMAGGDGGVGNGVPRTLTVTSDLEAGTFTSIVQICVTDTDLADILLTDEEVGLYIFNETSAAWELVGTNNVGFASPTSNVGDYGIFSDGFESGNTCAWAVVDGFSIFAVGQVTTYTLDLSTDSSANGSVAVAPERTVYSAGMEISVTARASTDFEFSDWLIDGSEIERNNPLTLTMDADKSVVGRFVQQTEQFALAVDADPQDGGSVEVSPAGDLFDGGREVTLTATAADGFAFAGWAGDVGVEDSPTNPLVITMDGDKSITAFFFPEEAELFQLSVSIEPAGSGRGVVTVSPALLAYADGTEVTLTGTAAEGFELAGWSGSVPSLDNPLVVTMTSDTTVIAHFEPLPDGDNGSTTGVCGVGAGASLSMCLMLFGLVSMKRTSRRRN